MLDPSMFSSARLLTALLKDEQGNPNWRRFATIVSYEDGDCKVMLKYQLMTTFLRHSRGPRQGHYWDVYGDNYQTPELALLALLEAEPPKWLLCNTDKLEGAGV